jgi:hypothetical protein
MADQSGPFQAQTLPGTSIMDTLSQFLAQRQAERQQQLVNEAAATRNADQHQIAQVQIQDYLDAQKKAKEAELQAAMSGQAPNTPNTDPSVVAQMQAAKDAGTSTPGLIMQPAQAPSTVPQNLDPTPPPMLAAPPEPPVDSTTPAPTPVPNMGFRMIPGTPAGVVRQPNAQDQSVQREQDFASAVAALPPDQRTKPNISILGLKYQQDPAKTKDVYDSLPKDAEAAQANDMFNPATKNAVVFKNGKYVDSITGDVVAQPSKTPPARDPLAQAVAQTNLLLAQQNLTDKQHRAASGSIILQGIKDGTIPADSQGLSRNGAWQDVVTAAASDGFDLAHAEKEWKAGLRMIQSLNGTQQLKLGQSITTLLGPNGNDGSLDAVGTLASQWNGLGLGILSRANLKVATEGGEGVKAQSLATRLEHQITEAAFEYAVVTQGGGVPSDQARTMAKSIMDAWWAKDTLLDNVKQAKQNIGFRKAAQDSSTPKLGNTGDVVAKPAGSETAADKVKKYF